jgi:predicted AlkP superfamily pyrophosphatase or phosphodiesterase
MRMKNLLFALPLLWLAAPCPAQEPARKVLIIGIDGCRPDALLQAKAPHLHKLIAEGAFSDQAQTGDITVSGPGWTSMLTGVWREKHGIRDNKFENADLKTHPHFFTRLKAKFPKAKTASIVHWAPINERIISACDHIITRKTDREVAAEAEKILARPEIDVVFIHFDDVDGAGHRNGFHPKVAPYVKAIEECDVLVGRLLAALAKRPARDKEDWLILVSTDHGGKDKGHGRNTPEERTIFVIMHGGGVKKGKIAPAPAIVDIAATALVHMGVAIDAEWGFDGRALK